MIYMEINMITHESIVKILEEFTTANLSSEVARNTIASRILELETKYEYEVPKEGNSNINTTFENFSQNN